MGKLDVEASDSDLNTLSFDLLLVKVDSSINKARDKVSPTSNEAQAWNSETFLIVFQIGNSVERRESVQEHRSDLR